MQRSSQNSSQCACRKRAKRQTAREKRCVFQKELWPSFQSGELSNTKMPPDINHVVGIKVTVALTKGRYHQEQNQRLVPAWHTCRVEWRRSRKQGGQGALQSMKSTVVSTVYTIVRQLTDKI
eukprot:363239-Chlamydomonas_euryale.AAC.12